VCRGEEVKLLRTHAELDGWSARLRDENLSRLDALCKILVDFCSRISLGVTLVSQLAPMDHHFFLDFIFH
jgi:hypothetical protein